MDIQMSWTWATRPASRMKDCGGNGRRVVLGEKGGWDGDVKKASDPVAKGQPCCKISFWRTHTITIMTTVQKIKVLNPSLPLAK
jgi:hypothetical protein